MADLKNLAKDTAIYGLSSIIGRFLNYLLVPLYTQKMSAASGEYGVITNVYALVALLLVILTYGMETTFFRYANKQGERAELVYSTTLWAVGFTSVLFIVLVLVFLHPIADALHYHDHPEYIWCMFTCVAIDAFQCIPFAYLRYQKRPLKFAALKLLFIFLNILLNVIYYLGMGGRDAGTAFYINLICTSIITFFFWQELRGFKHGFDVRLLKRMLSYSWPILVLGIAGILNQTADKILFPYLYQEADMKQQLAIYGAVFKIAMIMAMITQAFRYAYEPIVFSTAKERDSKHYYAVAMKYFLIFTLLAFLCVVAYIDLLKHIIGADYWVGLRVVPIVMAVLFAVNIIFVPRYGYTACAWGGFAGYATAMVLSYIVGQRYNAIDYPLADIARYVLLTVVLFVAMYFASAYLPMWVSLLVNTILVGVYLVYTVKHDFPLKSLPVVGKYFK